MEERLRFRSLAVPGPLTGLVVGLLCGRFFSELWWVWWVVLGAAGLGIFLASWVLRNLWIARCATVMVLVSLGVCLWSWWWGGVDGNDVRWLLGENEWVELRGKVESLPQQFFVNFSQQIQPKKSKWSVRFVLEVRQIRRFGQEWKPASGRVLVSSRMLDLWAVGYGDLVEVRGTVKKPQEARNPGEFNAKWYLENKRVFVELKNDATDVALLKRCGWSDFRRWVQVFREYMDGALSLGLGEEEFIAAVLSGMMYGDRTGFSEEWNEKFRRTGTMHLFAVSGQNISVLASVGVVVFWFLGMSVWRWAFLLVPPLWVYAAATGGQPSAIRAFVMASLLFVAWRLERPYSAVNLLCGACFLILCWDPGQLFDTGFQLSVCVMLVLILLTPLIYRAFKDAANPCEMIPRVLWSEGEWRRIRMWRALLGFISVSVAAYVGSLPLTWLHFHMISWIGVVANFVVVPVAALVVILGALSIATAWFCPWFAVGFNNVNWALVNFIAASVNFFSSIPFSSHYTGAASQWFAPKPRICVLAVEDDFSVIVLGSRGVELLGGGSDYSMSSITIPALKFFGVNEVTRHWLVAGSASVTGGAEILPIYFPVREYLQVGLPSKAQTLWKMRRSGKYNLKSVWADDVVVEKHYRWEVLWPEKAKSEESLKELRSTNRGLVLRWLAKEGRTVLFFVNADEAVIDEILSCGREITADVLILGGQLLQKFPNELLDAIRPDVVVFSTGGYKKVQVSPLLLKQFQERKISVWDLDEKGAAVLSASLNEPVRSFFK